MKDIRNPYFDALSCSFRHPTYSNVELGCRQASANLRKRPFNLANITMLSFVEQTMIIDFHIIFTVKFISHYYLTS